MFLKISRRLILAAAISAPAIAAGGCTGEPNPTGDNLPRVAVSGTVTLDGQPLPEGKIQFQPIGSEGPAVMAVAPIQDGKYAIERPSGPTPGKYRIMISSQPPAGSSAGAAPTPKPEPEKVPEKYNRKSREEVEITGDSPQTHDFSLARK